MLSARHKLLQKYPLWQAYRIRALPLLEDKSQWTTELYSGKLTVPMNASKLWSRGWRIWKEKLFWKGCDGCSQTQQWQHLFGGGIRVVKAPECGYQVLFVTCQKSILSPVALHGPEPLKATKEVKRGEEEEEEEEWGGHPGWMSSCRTGQLKPQWPWQR